MKSSKASAAWALVTTAMQMCISAGYHRASSSKNDTPLIRKQKSWIFWSLYSTEKGLSLRLGRSSSVSDYDITLPLPDLEQVDCKPYYSCTIRWIKLSSIQGRVYKMLYSPAALSEPQASRSAWAMSLAAEAKALYTNGEVGYSVSGFKGAQIPHHEADHLRPRAKRIVRGRQELGIKSSLSSSRRRSSSSRF
jgi:hypothetical protein